jgi:hypothetical protein
MRLTGFSSDFPRHRRLSRVPSDLKPADAAAVDADNLGVTALVTALVTAAPRLLLR